MVTRYMVTKINYLNQWILNSWDTSKNNYNFLFVLWFISGDFCPSNKYDLVNRFFDTIVMMNMSLKLVKLLELVYFASENRTEGKKEKSQKFSLAPKYLKVQLYTVYRRKVGSFTYLLYQLKNWAAISKKSWKFNLSAHLQIVLLYRRKVGS